MNDTTPVSEITQRARDAIGEDRPGSDWILRPEEHAANLPPEAGALKRILMSKECRDTQEYFRVHDTLAVIAQGRYKSAGRFALGTALIATLLGAALLPSVQTLPPEVRLPATMVQYLCLLAAILAARHLAFARPFDEWMKERALAEIARIKLFNDIMQANEEVRDSEYPLLPLKLEYFRRYQFDVQRRYHKGRGDQHARSAGHSKRWRATSSVLSYFAAAIAALALFKLSIYFRVLPPWLEGVAAVAIPFREDADRWLLALGVASAALYGFAAARSLMNLDERNASRYLITHDNLEFLGATRLPAARADAAAGRQPEVTAFVDRVQALISSEHQEWVRWRELSPRPDVRAVYIFSPK